MQFFQRSAKIISPPQNWRKHFSRKNLLQSIKYTLTKIYYTKMQHSEIVSVQLPLASSIQKQNGYTMNWFYIMYAYRSTVWKSLFLLHPDCTYLTRKKILSMLGTGYFLKINSQQEKPMCPSVVNAVRLFLTIPQF